MNIVLLTPSRRFIANKNGLGYQIPLGLVLIGGPLLDAGHRVRLIDNDLRGWDDAQLVENLAREHPDCFMIGHSSSTAAHPVAMRTAKAIRQAFPDAVIVYGGVYPTYSARETLAANDCVDVIVRGEGEETTVELANVLSCHREKLHNIRGITWRASGEIITNPSRPPIRVLDRFRPGWELVDWASYSMFGFGRSAGMQFSRGCTLRCTYCGQWSFWRRWRHRSPENVAEQMEILAKRYGVRIVWFADENFAADREATRQVLEQIARRHLDLSINLNMTAADVLRDADLLPLYKQAGVDNIIMGVESLNDTTVEKIRKNNPFSVSSQATRLLRSHGIVGLTNIIYGLEDENLTSLWRTFQRVLALDPDVLNAVYITPHHWTSSSHETAASRVIQPDQSYWTYRNQVIGTARLRPWQLFAAGKATEALFHLRPRAIWRMAFGPDRRYRRILRAYLGTGIRVVLAETLEFIRQPRQQKEKTAAIGKFQFCPVAKWLCSLRA